MYYAILSILFYIKVLQDKTRNVETRLYKTRGKTRRQSNNQPNKTTCKTQMLAWIQQAKQTQDCQQATYTSNMHQHGKPLASKFATRWATRL